MDPDPGGQKHADPDPDPQHYFKPMMAALYIATSALLNICVNYVCCMVQGEVVEAVINDVWCDARITKVIPPTQEEIQADEAEDEVSNLLEQKFFFISLYS
jgi:hypothetical protein